MRRALAAVALAAAALVLDTPGVAVAAGEDGVVTADRLFGSDRYATAAEVALAAHPGGAPAAVLARGDLFPDALAGSYLAGAVGGPVLLTAPTSLHPAAASALDDLAVDRVFVLGGAGAVSEGVVGELRSQGYDVKRIAGDDRYDTGALVAREAGEVGLLDEKRTALLASGAAFADALAAGPLAVAGSFPLLLTAPAALPDDTAEVLTALDIEHVVVLGGAAAVSDEVVAAVEAGGRSAERVFGDDRAATAAAVADLAVERLAWAADAVVLARQDAFPDGLAGGPLGGLREAPILLTAVDTLTPATASWLEAHQDTLASITVLGGTAAVADETLATAQAAAGHEEPAPYRVTGADAVAGLGTSRTCTVAAPKGTVVQLRLLPAGDVTADPLSFRDTDGTDGAGDGVADERPVRAVFTTVEGRALSPTSAAAHDVTSTGTIDVTLESAEYDHVVVVAFTDQGGDEDTIRGLDLDESGVPVEEAAAGCRTRFAPPDAAQGSHDGVTVHVVDVDAGILVGSAQDKRFEWTGTDTFLLGESEISRSRFEALLSRGDVVDVDYRTGEAGASTFTVTSDTVAAPAAPSVLATTLDGGSTSNDVAVSFEPPPYNGHGTRYRIFRVPTAVSGDSCTATISGTGTTVATVTEGPYADLDVSGDGECFMYRIVTVAAEGAVVQSPFSAPVRVPGPPPAQDTERPVSIHAEVTTDGGTAGALGAGDTVKIVFSEPLRAPVSGASITVTSGNDATATFTNGSGATFAINQDSEQVGGTTRSPKTVLTITITTNPSSTITLPATITSQSGIADLAGNVWDVNASTDTTLEA